MQVFTNVLLSCKSATNTSVPHEYHVKVFVEDKDGAVGVQAPAGSLLSSPNLASHPFEALANF